METELQKVTLKLLETVSFEKSNMAAISVTTVMHEPFNLFFFFFLQFLLHLPFDSIHEHDLRSISKNQVTLYILP